MKKLVILFVAGVLVGSGHGAAAQELLAAPDGVINGPPQLELPALPDVGSGSRDVRLGAEVPNYSGNTTGLEPIPAPIAAGDLQPGLQPYESGNEYRILDCEPALLESTGSWLRRGFWYSEIDVLLMDRIWQRDGFFLASQSISNLLVVDGGRSGVEGLPRLKLGRFLFRDHKNRDHTAELLVSGGGQWTQSGRLDAAVGGVLTVNGFLDGVNTSFDNATSMQYDYNSRFNNFELNYHVKARMRKDRMELEPSGHWVRRAQPSVSRSLLAGIRYFDLSEDFSWDAFGIDDDGVATTAPQTGNYDIRTDNDLIGVQLGGSWNYETARWSLGLQSKNGIYLNHTDVESNFVVTGGVTAGNNSIEVDNLSFISEASLVGKWHLRPNFSLRAGLEILYVSSVAHAPDQLNFIPVSTSLAIGEGDSTFMGGLVGFEGYW